MRFALFPVIFLLFLASCNNDKASDQATAATSSRYSKDFNGAIDTAMQAYYALTDRFVNWDSTALSGNAGNLHGALDGIRLTEVHEDSTQAVAQLEKAKGITAAMQGSERLEEKRHQLNELSQTLFGFLKTVRYDAKKMYLQECPMAFSDEDKGNWLSDRDTVVNPYLGRHHPRYKAAMLECGGNEAVIDNISK